MYYIISIFMVLIYKFVYIFELIFYFNFFILLLLLINYFTIF